MLTIIQKLLRYPVQPTVSLCHVSVNRS